MENKEYKVLASNTPLFGNREKMQRVLEEEAQAGWQLAEKYDNYKLRLVRDLTARQNDANCPVDPYRSQVGVHSAIVLGAAALLTILVIWAIIQLAALSVN